jgi:hypothetical protein
MSTTIERAPEKLPDEAPECCGPYVRRVLVWAGIAAGPCSNRGPAVGLLYDGYSFRDQAISELAAFGSPVRPLMVTVILLHNTFYLRYEHLVVCDAETPPLGRARAGRDRCLRDSHAHGVRDDSRWMDTGSLYRSAHRRHHPMLVDCTMCPAFARAHSI